MKFRFFIILLLTVSGKLVQTKTFECQDVFLISDGCEITKVTVPDKSIELSFLKNHTVTHLVISNSMIDDIPSISYDKSNGTVNLTYLECVGCGLKNITEKSFTSLSDLRILDISYGSYEKLQKDLFSHLSKLTYLELTHGAISEIDDEAFSGLIQLKWLYLSHNHITKITAKTFSSLENIFEINLLYNSIKVLDDGVFAKNDKLMYLDLSHNEITKIEGQLFNPQSIVSRLTLSHNNLTTFNIPNVKRVSVENNKIKDLVISKTIENLCASFNEIVNVTCDKNGSAISVLYMENNTLTNLDCIDSLTGLTDLNLNFNKLGKLKQNSFAALTNLKILTLVSSISSPLEFGVFSHQHKLEELDISYNHLENITLDILLAARGLEVLYIEGNNMTDFAYKGLTQTFTSLGKLGIGDNNFNCTFLAEVIKDLNIEIVSTYKVTDLHNVNGIGCVNKNDTVTPSPSPIDAQNKKFDTMIEKIVNLSQILEEKLKKLPEDLTANKQLMSSTEISQMNASLHFIKSVAITFIALISALCLYVGYRIVRNVSQLRRANTADTLYTNMEM